MPLRFDPDAPYNDPSLRCYCWWGRDGSDLVLCRVRHEIIADLFGHGLLANPDFRAVYGRRADFINQAASYKHDARDFAPGGTILLEASDFERLHGRFGPL